MVDPQALPAGVRAYLAAFLTDAGSDEVVAERGHLVLGRALPDAVAVVRPALHARARLTAEVEALVLVEEVGLDARDAARVIGMSPEDVWAVLSEAAVPPTPAPSPAPSPYVPTRAGADAAGRDITGDLAAADTVRDDTVGHDGTGHDPTGPEAIGDPTGDEATADLGMRGLGMRGTGPDALPDRRRDRLGAILLVVGVAVVVFGITLAIRGA